MHSAGVETQRHRLADIRESPFDIGRRLVSAHRI